MRVTNWEKWQTYRKDRGTPPWIKVHRNLNSNPEWAMLTDAEKGQLVCIWLVAADRDGAIPDDPRILRKIAMLDEIPDLNKFKDLGFLESDGCQRDAKVTPSERQSDAPETETETETELYVRFAQFWKSYPNKKDKAKANAKFSKLSEPDQQAAIADVERRSTRDPDWTKDNGKFVPS